jgi:hypothetical protein
MKPRQWMQIAAVASAMGLTGTAIANDMDRTPGTDNSSAATILDNDAASAQGTNPAADLDSNADVNGGAGLRDNASGNASSSTDLNAKAAPGMNRGADLDNSADVNGRAAPAMNRGGDLDNSADVNGNAATQNDNAASRDSSTSDLNGQFDRGTTQGSTMTSPRSNASTDADAPTGGARYGSGSSATSISGSDRLGSTNSDNFNTWMSDYASQHNGRITRQEFLAQMGNRWDQLDAQHQGYLTPDQVEEILVITPDSASSPDSVAPPRTGSDVQPGGMGPGNTRGD